MNCNILDVFSEKLEWFPTFCIWSEHTQVHKPTYRWILRPCLHNVLGQNAHSSCVLTVHLHIYTAAVPENVVPNRFQSLMVWKCTILKTGMPTKLCLYARECFRSPQNHTTNYWPDVCPTAFLVVPAVSYAWRLFIKLRHHVELFENKTETLWHKLGWVVGVFLRYTHTLIHLSIIY